MGLGVYEDSAQNLNTISNVDIVESLDELTEEPDIIVITVKNYSLEEVCHTIKENLREKKPLNRFLAKWGRKFEHSSQIFFPSHLWSHLL